MSNIRNSFAKSEILYTIFIDDIIMWNARLKLIKMQAAAKQQLQVQFLV